MVVKKNTPQKDPIWVAIQSLCLSVAQKRYLEGRFWDQYNWFSRKASQNHKRGNIFGLLIASVNVIVASIAGVNLGVDAAIRPISVTIFLLNIGAGVSTQVITRYQFDQKGDDYRFTAEILKSEFWILIADITDTEKIPEAQYQEFFNKVEDTIQADVQRLKRQKKSQEKSIENFKGKHIND